MSNAQHTPGPWRVTQGGNVQRDYRAIGSNSGELIAAAHGHDNSGFFPSEQERTYNAHLIAAAPDLLACLEFVESVYRQNVARDDEPSSVLAEMQRVISKAKGQDHV